MDELNGRRTLITGGTGSFGRFMTKELLKYSVGEVRIFSRDEYKQHKMRQQYSDKRVSFLLGDVRDYRRVEQAVRNIDIIFHAAALKQVPDCERHPLEAVKTNILGAANVKEAASKNHVKKVIAISTDKAVKPVNAMGMTKALQEKIMLSNNGVETVFSVVRYGNVLASRGSVVPLFLERKRSKLPLIVTDFRMTRFLLTLKDAVQLVFHALRYGEGGEIYVLKRPACLIKDLAEVVAEGEVSVIEGTVRAGEKIHETLVNEEEMRRVKEETEFYVVRPHNEKSSKANPRLFEYCSDKADRLTKLKIRELLKREKLL